MNLLERARAGDVEAIAALMNRHLQPKDITAKTDLHDGRLQVILESAQVPEQQAMVAFVYQGLSNLRVASIHKVRVCGRQTDIDFTVWIQDFDLATANSSSTPFSSLPPTFRNKPTPKQSVPHTKTTAMEIKCSKCGSTQLNTNNKGFGLGKAAAGAILLGPVGLLGGVWGSNQIMLTCLKCGHRWKPGKA